jgi:hypothetical protein
MNQEPVVLTEDAWLCSSARNGTHQARQRKPSVRGGAARAVRPGAQLAKHNE